MNAVVNVSSHEDVVPHEDNTQESAVSGAGERGKSRFSLSKRPRQYSIPRRQGPYVSLSHISTVGVLYFDVHLPCQCFYPVFSFLSSTVRLILFSICQYRVLPFYVPVLKYFPNDYNAKRCIV